MYLFRLKQILVFVELLFSVSEVLTCERLCRQRLLVIVPFKSVLRIATRLVILPDAMRA